MTGAAGPAGGPVLGAADEATRLVWFDALYHRNAFGICFGEGDQLTAANDAFLALLGWSREAFEAAPPTWRQIAPGGGTPDDDAANQMAIETGTWVPMERTWRRRDGTDVPVLIGGTVYDRARFRWVAYAFDISRQRDAEQALARSEERFALAVRGSSDGIWDWDLVEDRVFVSARAAEIIGHGDADQHVAGAGMAALIHPDDVPAWRDRIVAHFRDGQPYKQELQVRRRDGGWQWVRIRGQATFQGARAIRMAGTVTDIQARKEAEHRLLDSERRLAAAMRATSEGVYEFVLGQDVVWCSARTAEMLELDEIPTGGMVPWARMLVGQSAADVDRQVAALGESLVSGRPYDITVSRQRLDGTTQWLRTRAFTDGTRRDGQLLFVGSIADVTADVAARDALRASEARLWQAQKMEALGTLASGVAHDFNNLLAVILGYVEVGLAGKPTGLPAQALQEIGAAGRRATELVGRLLGFARGERGAVATHGPGASVAEAVAELRRFLAAAHAPGITVLDEVADGVPRVAIDPVALQQALLNLAVNALHAMREQGGTLRFVADGVEVPTPFEAGARELPAGSWVRIAVIDTGCGIAPDLLDRVIEPFFTTKAHGEGTGLGLSMVHGVVTAAGGGLRLRSALGTGTTVELWLPVAPAESPATAAAPAAPAARTVPGVHALVVDDDPAVAAVTAARLSLLGLQVTVRDSAEAALGVLEDPAVPLALVLVDRSMPGRPGEWLVAAAAERRPGVPVALMTGRLEADVAERATAAGAVAVLEKPVPTEALLALVGRAMVRPG